MGSVPTDRRTNPSGTSSPHRALLSAEVCSPPKLVVGLMNGHAAMKRSAAASSVKVTATTDPNPAHLLSGQLVLRMIRQPRISNARHRRTRRARRSATAAALVHILCESNLECFQPPVHQPCLERAGNRPRQIAPLGGSARAVRSAAGDVPRHDIGVAVHRLGVRRHDDIRPEVERALAQRGHGRVVGNQDRPGLRTLCSPGLRCRPDRDGDLRESRSTRA